MNEKSNCSGGGMSGGCGGNGGNSRLLRHMAAMFKSFGCNQVSNIETILRTLLRLLPGSVAIYNHFDFDRREITVSNSCRLPGGFRQSGPLEGRICYEELVISAKRSVYYNDLHQTRFYVTDPAVKISGMRSYAGAAVLHEVSPVGSLVVYNSKPNCFNPEDTLVLEIMAELVPLLEGFSRSKVECSLCPLMNQSDHPLVAADDSVLHSAAGAYEVGHFDAEPIDLPREPVLQQRELENLVRTGPQAPQQSDDSLAETRKRNQIADELRRQSERFKELNTALNVLLDRHQEERLVSEEKIRFKLRELIEPYLKKLENSGLNASQKQFLDLIRTNLEDAIHDPVSSRGTPDFIFSPNELQVANLIRKGKTSKEIAKSLGISSRTVESYRHSIRRKLDLLNKKVNLKTYLTSR